MHILLVEDNEHDIFFVREVLKRIAPPIELSVVSTMRKIITLCYHFTLFFPSLTPVMECSEKTCELFANARSLEACERWICTF
jgi:hypothetical protein